MRFWSLLRKLQGEFGHCFHGREGNLSVSTFSSVRLETSVVTHSMNAICQKSALEKVDNVPLMYIRKMEVLVA